MKSPLQRVIQNILTHNASIRVIKRKAFTAQNISSKLLLGIPINPRRRKRVYNYRIADYLNDPQKLLVKGGVELANMVESLFAKKGEEKEEETSVVDGKKLRLDKNPPKKERIKKGDAFSTSLGKLYKLFEEIVDYNNQEHKLELKQKEDDQKVYEERHEEIIEALEGLSGKKNKTIARFSPKKKGAKSKIAKTAIGVGGLAAAGAASAMMTPSDTDGSSKTGTVTASQFISQKESFSAKAYADQGHTAIGYGHDITEQEFKQGYIQAGDERIKIEGGQGMETKISKDQAQKLLQNDIPKYEKGTIAAIGEENYKKLNENQKAALVSYTYNAGPGGMKKLANSGLKDAIAQGDMQKAGKLIDEKGVKTGEKSGRLAALEKRRKEESDLFLRPVESAIAVKEASGNVKISSHFLRDSGAPHGALDLPGKEGSAIFSTGDGKVVYAGPAKGFGNHFVKIDHGNGVETLYGHMSANMVQTGQTVKAGQLIGAMGNEGDSTGTHLHYQINVNNKAVDPETQNPAGLLSYKSSVRASEQVASTNDLGKKINQASVDIKDNKNVNSGSGSQAIVFAGTTNIIKQADQTTIVVADKKSDKSALEQTQLR